METLYQIWKRLADVGYETDKFSVHSYGDVYEKLLAPYRETAKTVLEIGIFKGNSLRMWEQYFTTAYVHGIDCSETPHGGLADLRPMIKEEYHNIHIMDATDKFSIEQRFFELQFDVIIEDAGHHIEQQVELFNIWKDYMSPNSIYIIEDAQDIDKDRWVFDAMASEFDVQIIDLREKKKRYDDVLVIIRKK